MDKPVFSYHDGSLTAASAAAGLLRVIVGTDGFSWMASDPDGNINGMQTWQFQPAGKRFPDVDANIRYILGQQMILRFPFGKTIVAYSNPNITLVPRRLFREEDLASYLKLLIQPDDYTFRFDEIPELDCFAAYAIESQVIQTCKPYFEAGNQIHLGTSLIKSFRTLQIRQGYEVAVNLRNQVAQVMVFDRQILLFYNTFRFEQPNDLLYALLLAFDQFRLNPVETPLILAGNLLEDSAIYRLLYRYFRHIHFAAVPNASNLPTQMTVVPNHCFFDLLTLGL
jgi:hypothetical protein